MDQNIPARDYSTISPSARGLLLLKSKTTIPFAAAAARLVPIPEGYEQTYDFAFWARALHFEARYRSIDQLLEGLGISNILELSSGFSFRGLQTVQERNVHYIDTDLDEVIGMKQSLAATLS